MWVQVGRREPEALWVDPPYVSLTVCYESLKDCR